MRQVLGVTAGLLLAAAVLSGLGLAVTRMHPPPAGFDPRALPALAAYVEAAPPPMLWLLACACGLASLAGAWPAARIARGHRGAAALWIGAPLTLLAIAAAALVPQPDWVVLPGMLLPIPLAVAAWRLALPRGEL